MWSIFGGKLQGDETTMDGAKREFFEETGVDVDGRDIKFIGLIPRYTRDGFKIKGLMYVYLLDSDIPITLNLANAIDGEEHTEWKYFTLNEIDPNKTGDFVYRLGRNHITMIVSGLILFFCYCYQTYRIRRQLKKIVRALDM